MRLQYYTYSRGRSGLIEAWNEENDTTTTGVALTLKAHRSIAWTPAPGNLQAGLRFKICNRKASTFMDLVLCWVVGAGMVDIVISQESTFPIVVHGAQEVAVWPYP